MDNQQATMTITLSVPDDFTYRREAYEYDCVMPRRQFERDFILVENKQQAVARRAATNIKKIRAMLVAGGKK